MEMMVIGNFRQEVNQEAPMKRQDRPNKLVARILM